MSEVHDNEPVDMLDMELADTLEQERIKHRRAYDLKLARLGRIRQRPINEDLHMPLRPKERPKVTKPKTGPRRCQLCGQPSRSAYCHAHSWAAGA